jgi:hypothetical protein
MNLNVNNLPDVTSKFKTCLFSFFLPFILQNLFFNINCRRHYQWSPCKIGTLVLLWSLVLTAVVTVIVVTVMLMQKETCTSTTVVPGNSMPVRRHALYVCFACHLYGLGGTNEKLDVPRLECLSVFQLSLID